MAESTVGERRLDPPTFRMRWLRLSAMQRFPASQIAIHQDPFNNAAVAEFSSPP